VTAGFTELIPPPTHGRVFTQPARPGLADCAPSGRTRLDALARMLQDVAYADVDDAGLATGAAWVVRRTRLRVDRWPRFGERMTLRTFCSGLGRMWAERRTTIATGESAADVEAVSLWVHLDPESWRPRPFDDLELAIYGEAAGGRQVSARLRHPRPANTGDGQSWRFRATDCDIAGHVNNAAYWQPLEEHLLASAEPERLDVELEYRAPTGPGEKEVLRDGNRWWILEPSGETLASLIVSAAR
jgi:acyl-ACP thioesterase